MHLRCKAGELALIIHDEECCRPNIGKLVQVAGPVGFNSRLRKDCWLIEPVKPEPWHCVNVSGVPYQRVVTFANQVEHPDDWLLTIDPVIFRIRAATDHKTADQCLKHQTVRTAPAPNGLAPWVKKLLDKHGIPMAPRNHWIYS